MKIEYQVNKTLPDVQYLANIKDIPMATTNPELTVVKVEKTRLDRKGITFTENKSVDISVFEFIWSVLHSKSLKQIVEEKTGDMYTFNHKF